MCTFKHVPIRQAMLIMISTIFPTSVHSYKKSGQAQLLPC